MRFIFTLLLLFGFLSAAQAKDFTDKYVPVTPQALVNFAAHYKALDLTNPSVFAEFLQVTDCSLYMSLQNSQFKQQETQQEMLQKMQTTPQPDSEIYFKVPILFKVSSYNFETQSLMIQPSSQMRRVNIFPLTDMSMPVCGTASLEQMRNIPNRYNMKMNFPVSLYRIPLQKTLAESIFTRLDKADNEGRIRFMYGNIYLQIDAIQPKTERHNLDYTAQLFGQINAIDLYVDQDHRILIKRLDYSGQ
ncbi:MAG: hypothetical protein JWM96_1120 [Alphaproteobacteria bacterium]|nr:hypothetical protein [Alphaproteobacteria bacterium]